MLDLKNRINCIGNFMLSCCDLFCGGGGAAYGLHKAGFEIIEGFDHKAQYDYPYEFFLEDATKVDLEPYDFIWASPPCQKFSVGTGTAQRKKHPDLVDITRQKLLDSGKPFIIENVPNAPLINPVQLCGTMFEGLKVFRHRLFESNVPLVVDLFCNHKGHSIKTRRTDDGDFFTVAGHWVGTMQEWGDAMGIHWMTNRHTLAESVPPAYSEYLGKQVIKWLLN